jgi:hypothetical protein
LDKKREWLVYRDEKVVRDVIPDNDTKGISDMEILVHRVSYFHCGV